MPIDKKKFPKKMHTSQEDGSLQNHPFEEEEEENMENSKKERGGIYDKSTSTTPNQCGTNLVSIQEQEIQPKINHMEDGTRGTKLSQLSNGLKYK